MVSLHRIPAIATLWIFIGAIQQVADLGRGRDKTKKATENYIERMVWSQKSHVPQASSSTSISEITISYLHKNIVIPLLCQCELFIHTCVSKNSVMF